MNLHTVASCSFLAMIAVARETVAQSPLSQGLIARWAFDDAADLGHDSAGSHQGTLAGTTLLTTGLPAVAGNVGAVQMAGSGAVTVPSAPDLTFTTGQPMSFSLWIKQTTAQTVFHVFGKRSGCTGFTGMNYQLCRDTTHSGLYFVSANTGAATGLVAAGVDLPIGQWCHVALAYDGAVARIYLQGTLQTTQPFSFTAANTSPLVLGGSGTCGASLIGAIDDVRFYDRALSQTEITALAGLSFAGATSVGNGCNGNTLAAADLPWVQSTFHAVGSGLPMSAIVVAATSFTAIAQGTLPLVSVFPQATVGCDLLVAPDILEALITTTGTAQSSLLLPNAPLLVGSTFYQQMVSIGLDAQGNWISVTATNALQLTAGMS